MCLVCTLSMCACTCVRMCALYVLRALRVFNVRGVCASACVFRFKSNMRSYANLSAVYLSSHSAHLPFAIPVQRCSFYLYAGRCVDIAPNNHDNDSAQKIISSCI